MSRKKWSQPLIWGMIIAILNPLGISYIALIGVVCNNADVCLVCDAGVGYLFLCHLFALYPPSREPTGTNLFTDDGHPDAPLGVSTAYHLIA
jgi:hypothetical protein